MIMGLSLSSALLENTAVEFFPEEMAACNYAHLAVQKELRYDFGIEVTLFLLLTFSLNATLNGT